MPLSAGETFGGYRIVRLLGSGGMGEVYLAEHPRLPRRDALKVLPADISADADYRARFNREADLASKLWHPNIVSVHDRGEFNGQLWISMDYVDGLDAFRLLTDRYPSGIPVDQVLRIVTAVASALDYAHKQGLLHRDVKPANVMLTHVDDQDDGQRILLADFGIARDVGDISGLTSTNMTVGTAAYSAPEQLMGEEIDGRADQYALAATTYHLLTGSHLFPHSNPAVVISRHLNSSPPALADSRRDLAALDPVLAVALAKDPGKRFSRCADFARALKQAATPGEASAAAPTAPAPAASKPEQAASTSGPPRRWHAPAAVLAVSVVIAAVVLTWHPWRQSHGTAATSTTAHPPSVSASSAAAPPPPAAAPTSAAPVATKVITVVPVVNGQPANGYREGQTPGNAHQVFGCDASPAAVSFNIYKCYPSAADADVCWPSMPGTLLCLYTPWDKQLYREFYTDALPAAEPPPTPEPFALLLDDGTQCRLRNGGAWVVRNDGYLGAYGCPSDSPAVLIPAPGTPAIDRSHPLWTVKVGPLGIANFPPPETHTVTTAYFAGN
ncbi:serine/threonine-protein kinase [Mycobacterium sp. SP-6446]|uniref:serine/threonine-protein kinase n=1 Tax=Mycobacterium sp. SP-6446 TaxID=1834162 RepID=UPI0009FA7BD9|nr:serine/threonine-protein kinase [Mycobacterium sp. SP-6446]